MGLEVDQRVDKGVAADILTVDIPSQPPGLFGVYATTAKRLVDLLLVIAVLPILLPLILGAAALSWTAGTPMIVAHRRVGRHGRPFKLYKFRSMVLDHEAVLDQYLKSNPSALEEWSKTRRLANDPRVTRVGRILRKTRLQELPQLFNVALGDMSLVGPAPLTEDEFTAYPAGSYYFLRPGITGLWQVAAPYEPVYKDRAVFDVAYGAKLSPVLDARILFRALSPVLGIKDTTPLVRQDDLELYQARLEQRSFTQFRPFFVRDRKALSTTDANTSRAELSQENTIDILMRSICGQLNQATKDLERSVDSLRSSNDAAFASGRTR